MNETPRIKIKNWCWNENEKSSEKQMANVIATEHILVLQGKEYL